METTFQPADGCWDDYACRPGLRSVLDPADAGGAKNAAIDLLHRRALDRALGQRRFRRALDFGCGTGRLGSLLARRAAHVVAVDPTVAMLERAARTCRHLPLSPVRFDGRRLPLADASLDLVVSVYVLQYAVRDGDVYRAVLAELCRVLAPGGRLVCIEQASAHARGSGSVSVGRTVLPQDYVEPATALGLECRGIRAVRLGRPGRLERRLLLRPGVPARLRRVAAQVALWRAARLGPVGLAAQPYVDWLFELAAPSTGGEGADYVCAA